MTNPIIHGIEDAAEATGHAIHEAVDYAIVNPIEFLAKAEAVIATAITSEPELKTATLGLVKQFDAIGADTIADIASKGLDVNTDLKTFVDVQNLFRFFTASFMPAVEQVYGQIQSDIS
jgi:hypothetical protein